MENNKKAATLMARYQALSNAAEFIRSHGEEGFSYKDEAFTAIYFKEAKKIAYQLDKRAEKLYDQFVELGIDVNTDIDDLM